MCVSVKSSKCIMCVYVVCVCVCVGVVCVCVCVCMLYVVCVWCVCVCGVCVWCVCVCVCVCVCRSLRCPLSGISVCFPKRDVFGGGSRWVWSTSTLGQLWSYLAGDHRMGEVETGVT